MMDNANLGQPDICWTRKVYKCVGIVEFFLNYTKVATLAIKAYVGKSKINLAKKVTSSVD